MKLLLHNALQNYYWASDNERLLLEEDCHGTMLHLGLLF